MTNLFYLKEMDVGSVNIPYLLDRYLRLFTSRRKHGAMIPGGPERQQVATAEAIEDALVVDEGALAIPTPVQAPQLPPPMVELAKTMA
nr:hypothetical protein [Tanacetum cinerariifolium]